MGWGEGGQTVESGALNVKQFSAPDVAIRSEAGPIEYEGKAGASAVLGKAGSRMRVMVLDGNGGNAEFGGKVLTVSRAA